MYHLEPGMSYNYEKFINKLTINQTLLLLKIIPVNKIKNKKSKNNNLDDEYIKYSQLLSILSKDDIIHLKKMYLNNNNIIDFYHYFSNLSDDLDKYKYLETIIMQYNKIYKKLV